MTPLISAPELRDSLDQVKLADVRWYLGQPGRGHEAYHSRHIPGAVFVSLADHLSSQVGPGRHPLPSRDEFAATAGRLGFGDDDAVVVYDDRGGVVAARMWWMLRDIGHESVRLLDGGLQAWESIGGMTESDPGESPPTTMSVRQGSTRSMDRDALAARMGSITIVDARASERYRGEDEPIDPIGGHIPGALNAPTEGNLDDEGRFLAEDQMRERFEMVTDDEVVVYCGSGVSACHDILAMHIAGRPEPILYPGSWSDWSSSDMPIATGPQPG